MKRVPSSSQIIVEESSSSQTQQTQIFFKYHDKDNDGFIPLSDMVEILGEFVIILSREDLEKIIIKTGTQLFGWKEEDYDERYRYTSGSESENEQVNNSVMKKKRRKNGIKPFHISYPHFLACLQEIKKIKEANSKKETKKPFTHRRSSSLETHFLVAENDQLKATVSNLKSNFEEAQSKVNELTQILEEEKEQRKKLSEKYIQLEKKYRELGEEFKKENSFPVHEKKEGRERANSLTSLNKLKLESEVEKNRLLQENTRLNNENQKLKFKYQQLFTKAQELEENHSKVVHENEDFQKKIYKIQLELYEKEILVKQLQQEKQLQVTKKDDTSSLLSEIYPLYSVKLTSSLPEESPAPENLGIDSTQKPEPLGDAPPSKLIRRPSKSILEKTSYFEQRERDQSAPSSSKPPSDVPPSTGAVKETKKMYETISSSEDLIKNAVAQYNTSIYGSSTVGKLLSNGKPRPQSTIGSSKLDILLKDAISTMKQT